MSDQTEREKERVLAKFLGKHTLAELREFQQNKAEIFEALAKRIEESLSPGSEKKATRKKPSRKQLRALKNRKDGAK